MADPDFETRLSRWFAETPAFGDSDAFARRIETRLDRSWAMRRVLIGAAGLSGGLVAAAQMLGANVFHKVADVSEASMQAMSQGARTVGQLRLLTTLPVGGEVLWMGAGLAVLALVLMATRSLEEF